MKSYIFSHQLGSTVIKVNSDGTAIFRRKKYSSYKSARQALTRFYGFAFLVQTY